MEAQQQASATIYALEPVETLCARCRERAAMHVIVLPPAVASRASRPVHTSAWQRVADGDDDLANATWEDAAWQ